MLFVQAATKMLLRLHCPGDNTIRFALFLSDGQRLEGRGVTPDIAVSAPDLADLRANRDRDVQAALTVLHSR